MNIPESSLKLAEFARLSARERIRLCRFEADRARTLAEGARPVYRDAYLDICRQWNALADDIERAARQG
jgi:hypothetical protein